MNLFNRAFLAALVVFSGSVFGACKSCNKRSGRTAAVAMRKVVRSGRSMRASGNTVRKNTRVANRSTRTAPKARTARRSNAVSGKARSEALAAYLHAKKGCKNGVCKR